MTVTVYEKPQCVQCVQTKRVLDAKGIKYVVRDLSDDALAMEEVKRLGFLQAPVVEAGDESWSGFRPDKIDELVKRLNNEEEM